MNGPRVAVVFQGQESLRAGMAQQWDEDPSAGDLFDEASDLLKRNVVIWWQDPVTVNDPVVAQLAVFVCGVAAHRSLISHGLRPVALAGHGIGEYAALEASGALRFGELLAVVKRRAELMGEACCCTPGAMAAVVGNGAPTVARDVVAMHRGEGSLVLANENGPTQAVISGSVEAIEQAQTEVLDVGLRCVRLRVAGAFHSPLMQSAAEHFDEVLATLAWSTPSVPVIPNVDAVPTRDPDRLSALLRRQMLAPVRWTATSHALGQLALDAVVECGAIPTLGPLIHQVHPSLPTYLLTSAEAFPPSLARSAAFASTTTA